MNILHTSDWHIGKRLADRERLSEQKEALDELVEICEQKQVSLVLVAGDIFDTFTPSAEAEELFFSAVKKLAGEHRSVVIIAGNHDDALRLSSSAPLAEQFGIYIFGNTPKTFSCTSTRRVRAIESGENYLVIENEDGDCVYINALSYPNEARLKEEKTEESYVEKIQRWIAHGETGYRHDMPHILLSHLFVAGGTAGSDERDISLGGARIVPLSALPNYGYIALGHLHKPQALKHARYSGSLLQYSFDEANTEKGVLLLKTHGTEIEVAEQIPLRSGKRLVRLECNSVENALERLKEYPNCFIELTLRLKQPLTTQDTHALKACNEGLVLLIPKIEGVVAAAVEKRSSLSPEQLFTEYYRSVYGDDPEQQLKEAFLHLLEEE